MAHSAVILTGGFDHLGALSLVMRYNVKGEATSLPSLKTKRMQHACGTYKTVESISNPNEQVGCGLTGLLSQQKNLFYFKHLFVKRFENS